MATGIHKPLSSGSVITKGSVIAAFVFLFAGWLVGMFVHQFIGSGNLFPWSAPLGYRVGAAWQAYAGLFVLAAAIERLIQPFSDFLGDAPAAGTVGGQPGPPAQDAPAGGSLIFARIDTTSKKNTAIVTWGVASGLGCLACALLGVGLLTAIQGDGTTPATWLDVLVSGLVVGAGTKPLHDLITNIQASKDAKQTQVPTAPAAQ